MSDQASDLRPAVARAGHESTLPLRGVLDVSRALELHRGLLALSEESPAVSLDLSEVTELDAAAVQLLVALERRTLQRAGSFRVERACESIAAVLTRAGCAHWLA